ncbi:hypothetical protein PC111_g23853 [Phytophthora cactorum]|uniref:Uncharacterized protein n=1 Tax=Phytophthora cactorum TaxID=29920 RepID=A0A8T1ABC2_9STRA|nr:hypothetical protein PC111_g23853 [Phytophthora cactorum]KAG2791982.1 hypothetical protein PC112_g24045 [Phytophthora cactorum]KAG2871427.1 hypothetical protein PC114_g26931 [Phytophthora cactorum]KAG2874867.1 hypothetical protein PC115_g24047 [Phytophthora cactorum]KAG2878720.1 hypothetical protein PC117_g26896 [Phytophthora cactorum]
MVKDPLVTLDWNGGIDTNEHSGLIKLNVMKNATLEPPGVRYAPGGTTNLLSQRLLEQTGRKPSFSVASDDRLRRMYFDKVELRLEFKKRNDGFYWLTASPVMTLASMTPKAFETLEDNIVVMKWQYKLAHSNCNVCEIPSVVNGPPAISYPLLTNQLQALMALLVFILPTTTHIDLLDSSWKTQFVFPDKIRDTNEAAMKTMVKNGLAKGMDGLSLNDFKRTPVKRMLRGNQARNTFN